MDPVKSTGVIGADVPRVDSVAKVTGAATYGADHPVDRVAWAYLVTSTVAKGKRESASTRRPRGPWPACWRC